ncbi:MAG TPA: lipoyl(octanoyl) transferase LipB [Anaerolineales bacterium]|nr:lipoyl(octanoyl) transferase LipB [Anaerolineales bacterium]
MMSLTQDGERVSPGTAVCEVRRLGLVPYSRAWTLQNEMAAEIAQAARPATLLLLEHPHTFTFGRRGQANNLLWDEAELARREVEVHWVDRGGDVTYHGPGQLVGYPLLPLGRLDSSGHLPKRDFVGYLRKIEDGLIRALSRFGLVSGQIPGLTGVWVQPDVASRCVHCPPAARRMPSKLASIGVKIDVNGVSRHGFALNVAPDMSYWEGIVPCGLTEYPMISLAELVEPAPAMDAVVEAVVGGFGMAFDLKMVGPIS